MKISEPVISNGSVYIKMIIQKILNIWKNLFKVF